VPTDRDFPPAFRIILHPNRHYSRNFLLGRSIISDWWERNDLEVLADISIGFSIEDVGEHGELLGEERNQTLMVKCARRDVGDELLSLENSYVHYNRRNHDDEHKFSGYR
jgi:hypothetical protein